MTMTLAEKFKALGERRAAEGTLAPPDPPDPPASPRSSSHAGRSGSPTQGPWATPDDGFSTFAMDLAQVLDDHRSLRFYQKLSERVHGEGPGRLLPRHPRSYVRSLMLGKARELRAKARPHGPIARPPAVFAHWVKKIAG